MSLPATEVFTDADGTALTTHSANWSLNAGNFQIEGNALAANGAAAATDCAARWSADTFPNDQYAQCVISQVSASVNARVGVGVRIATDGTANYYGLEYDEDAGEVTMFKVTAGVWAALGAVFAGARVATDILRLEIVGTTLTYKLNGTTQGTRTDSALSAGAAGVVGRGLTTTHRIDTWEGGSLSSGTVLAPKGTKTARGIRRRKRALVAAQIKAKRQGNQAIRPVKRPTVVKGRRRKPQRVIQVTQIKAKRQGNQAHPPRVSPIVAKGRRRKPQRVIKVTQIKAKRQGNQAIKPPRQLVVKGRKRRQKTLHVSQLRAKPVVAPVTPFKAPRVLVVRPAKRRARKLKAGVIGGATRSSRLRPPSTFVVKPAKRRTRKLRATVIKGATRSARLRPPSTLVVKPAKRRVRKLKTVVILGATRAAPRRASLTIVLRKKRAARKVSARVLASRRVVQPATATRAASPLTDVFAKKRRIRKGKATQLRAKVAGNQAIRPPKSAKVVAGRRRRRRTGDAILVTGARRAAVPAQRPVKPQTQVIAKRRKKRLTAVRLVTGARRAQLAVRPAKTLLQVSAKRRRKHGAASTVVSGAKRALSVRRKALLQTAQAVSASRRKHQRRTQVVQTTTRRKKKSISVGLVVTPTGTSRLVLANSSAPRYTVAKNSSQPRYTVKPK